MRLNTRKKLVISYVRFSTPPQEFGNSQLRQMQSTERWCKENGEQLTDKLFDGGISAYRGKNSSKGDLAEFLKLVQAGTIPQGSILLVEDLDRISRQAPEVSIPRFMDIVNAGCTVVTLNDGMRYEKGKLDMGRLMMSVMRFCLSHEESEKKSYRVGKAWKTKKENAATEPLTKLVPFWLKLENGKIELIPEHVALVRKVYQLASAGFGHHRILQEMNKSKIKSARGKATFARSYVAKLLHNRAVLGEYQPHSVSYDADNKRIRTPVGEVIRNYYPPIITEQQFYAVQNAMKGRRTGSTGPSSKFVNVFSGLLFDLEGNSLQIVDKGLGKRYVSSVHIDKRPTEQEYVAFPVDVFERSMLTLLSDSSLFPELEATADNRQEAEGVAGQIAEVNDKLAQLSESLLTLPASKTKTLIEAISKLESQRDALTQRHEALLSARHETPMTTVVAQLVQFLQAEQTDNTARMELRAAVKRMVKRIDCHLLNDGRDKICSTHVVFSNDGETEFAFAARFVDRMKRNELGHPIKGGAEGIPEWTTDILVTD